MQYYDPLGIKLLYRLRLGLSHLREHKFRHNFPDNVNPLCSCSLEIESMEHYFLCCHNYVIFRTTLMNELTSAKGKLEPEELVRTILYRDKNFDNDSNFKILTVTIHFIKQTQQFEQTLF